jgi:hypothetical protein
MVRAAGGSGAPSCETDKVCVRAGINPVIDDIDLAKWRPDPAGPV